MMIDTNGKFYLGRVVDAQTNEKTNTPLLYDPDDLVTHAVVVGMTGSGKTGLCLDLLEEAALNNVPALMIDPKGDITNALMHFPNLAPVDFQPWINANEARREGKTAEQAAEETAALWRNGLAGWDIQPERIQKLKDSAQFAIYTPGSDAGLPVSILASLKAPDISWNDNRELLREKISGTVTALLGLVGLKDIDPVRAREHILLSNIFEHAWSQGQDLDLASLIMQTQSPPFTKLGVFDVNTFFPEKDRFELAMMLNNILASPAFQAWIEGEPLDVASLLYQPDGRPRHTIFYIAHLSEAERMFFVTLLYSAVESWMRAQKGSTTLRALVYFDEIFGYLPPTANPPSKEPMLRMLKQARAFGVGMVLATQNPVDVDYKALSNAGTWFIGKLGTEQDKARLLDGLTTAASGGFDRRVYDDLISALGKRVFLLRNVHDKQPSLFQTRWAMNYLAGPVTRDQIPALNALAGVGNQLPVIGNVASRPLSEQSVGGEQLAATTPAIHDTKPSMAIREAAPEADLPGEAAKPGIPGRTEEFFLPQNLTLSEAAKRDGRSLPTSAKSAGILYQPVLLAQATVRFSNRRYNLDHEVWQTAVVPEPDRRGVVRWQDYESEAIDDRQLDRAPALDARFQMLEAPLDDAKALSALKKDFADWIYRGLEVEVKANEGLKIYGGPNVSERDFAEQCADAAKEKSDAESKKVAAQYEKKIDSLENKLKKEERELAEDEAEYSQRKREEAVTHAETLFSLFSKRRRSVSSSMTKRRMTAKAKADIEESKDQIEEYQKDIVELEEEAEDALQEIKQKWEEIAQDTTTLPVTPAKSNINTTLFGVAWLPHHIVQTDDDFILLPGFAQE
ncbi:helicase HerA domain-containing protein [Candidatus Leptofilum sp.]|uniref:ATP-binding protein n=1 Tax=Candidatus Leptofilum sp. TaxID=3241576 RepID=UPI003B5BD329